MGYLCLTSFLIFTISLVPMAQGNENCLNDRWTYHRDSHTCFQYLFNPERTSMPKRTWADSNAGCQEFLGGPSRSKPGNLARIYDQNTNVFIQNMVPVAIWETYIGLYYNTDVNDYRWTGYPNEVLSYTWLDRNRPTPVESYPYMVISKYQWLGKRATDKHPAICQHDAVTPGINLACPSLPLRVNAIPDQSITCEFLYNVWTSAAISLGYSKNLVGTCRRDKPCTVEDGYSMAVSLPALTVRPNKLSLEFTDKVTRQQEGVWTCSVSNVNGILESKSCQINVYEPPTDVSCRTQLSATAITVDCTTDRIYPKAVCVWPYTSSQDNDLQRAFRLNDDVIYSHTHFTQEPDDGTSYYKSVCSSTLTLDDGAKINPGYYSVLVLVYPELAVSDSSFKKTSGYKAETFVLIESPQDPVFQYQNGTDTEPSVVYQRDDIVQLKCEISQGKPGVESTSVSCDFPISQSGDRTQETTGNVHVLNIPATVDMDGKTCGCWGKHISGDTRTTSVAFKILVPARVNDFGVGSLSTFELQDTVTLSCQAVGIPFPLVDIFRLEGEETKDKLATNQVNGISKANFKAQCTDNAKFQCRAQNTLKGRLYNSTSEVTVRVKCGPTPCNGRDDEAFETTPGNGTVLSLCFVAYPAPEKEFFVLEKDDGQVWRESSLQLTLDLVLYSDVLKRVLVTLYQIQRSDTGYYRMYYRNGGGSVPGKNSYLHFRLTATERTEESEESGLGTGAIIGIVATVFVVGVVISVVTTLYVSKVIRHRRKDRKRQETDSRVSQGQGQAESEFQGVGGGAPNESSTYVYGPSDFVVKLKSRENAAFESAAGSSQAEGDYLDIDEVVKKPDAGGESYNTLSLDDPNYIRMKREPRQYMNIK